MCFRSLGLGTKSQLTARSGYQPSDHQTNLKLIANSPWKRWKYLVVLLFWKIKLSLKIDWSRKGCYSLPAINKRVYILLLLFPCTPLGLIVDTASDPIENKYYWGSESYSVRVPVEPTFLRLPVSSSSPRLPRKQHHHGDPL